MVAFAANPQTDARCAQPSTLRWRCHSFFVAPETLLRWHRERRQADIANPIGPRNSARRPTQRLHGIALSSVATPYVVEPQRDLAVAEQVRNGPVRHACVNWSSRCSGAGLGTSRSSGRAQQ